MKITETIQVHSSMNSLDWEGVYTGILPCADCEGIKTRVKLSKDLTYLIETEYLGKSSEAQQERGTFSWNRSGNTIILNIQNKNATPSFYKVAENQLIQLDLKGNPITGDLSDKYTLKKKSR